MYIVHICGTYIYIYMYVKLAKELKLKLSHKGTIVSKLQQDSKIH